MISIQVNKKATVTSKKKVKSVEMPDIELYHGILEDEVNLIEKSGKSIKDFLRENW
jgi:hypothetical protein